jgi:hypothetical protein
MSSRWGEVVIDNIVHRVERRLKKMKINFKKVSAIAASVLMTGLTMGTAMAANYPAPFVVSGGADVAVAYGTGAGVSSLDLVQAGNIQSSLQSYMSGSSGTPDTVVGDSVLLERAATKFSLGKGITDVVSGTLTNDDLSNILKDGKYLDNDNDEFEYTQKIALANLSLSLFDDSDYKSDTPTVGIQATSGTHILNYTLEFSTNPEWADLSNTNIEIMGKSYFVSSTSTNATINLLDSANTATVAEGETKNVNVGSTSYSVTIASLSGDAGSPEVKLSVNGQTTNSLSKGQTYKLTDGTYVGIKDISMRDVAGTTSSVEFSLGTGKIELRTGLPVRINDKTINGLTAWFTSAAGTGASGVLNKIILEWNADDDLFATEDSSIILPGLENVKLSFSGMSYPKEETFTVEKGSNTYIGLKDFPLKSGNANIDLLYGNGTGWTGTGKEATKKLLTSAGNSITFDADDYQYFIATYDDTTNAESYLVRATSFGVKNDGVTNTTDIQYYSDGSWVSKKSEASNGDSINLGSVSLTVGAIDKTQKTVVLTKGTSVNFNTLFSKEGLKVYLPIANYTSNYTLSGTPVWPQFAANSSAPGWAAIATTYPLGFAEETKTGTTGAGNAFNATLSWTDSKTTVSDIVGETPNGGYEIGSTEVMRSFIYGPLATEILLDQNGDQDSAKIVYHGDESYGKVYVSEIGATITAGTGTTTGTQLGDVLVKDSEVSSVSSKNLIVVGGSCINSVAANVLGAAACSADFTAKTGIGSGQFLIQSFASPYATNKVVLLVSGYEAADTVNAATYLRTQAVDTTVGKKYQGTSATTATLVTTSA